MNLKNKVVLISGIGKGIGNQIFFDCLNNADFTYGILRNKNYEGSVAPELALGFLVKFDFDEKKVGI